MTSACLETRYVTCTSCGAPSADVCTGISTTPLSSRHTSPSRQKYTASCMRTTASAPAAAEYATSTAGLSVVASNSPPELLILNSPSLSPPVLITARHALLAPTVRWNPASRSNCTEIVPDVPVTASARTSFVPGGNASAPPPIAARVATGGTPCSSTVLTSTPPAFSASLRMTLLFVSATSRSPLSSSARPPGSENCAAEPRPSAKPGAPVPATVAMALDPAGRRLIL